VSNVRAEWLRLAQVKLMCNLHGKCTAGKLKCASLQGDYKRGERRALVLLTISCNISTSRVNFSLAKYDIKECIENLDFT
jgi:hypothetical protein